MGEGGPRPLQWGPGAAGPFAPLPYAPRDGVCAPVVDGEFSGAELQALAADLTLPHATDPDRVARDFDWMHEPDALHWDWTAHARRLVADQLAAVGAPEEAARVAELLPGPALAGILARPVEIRAGGRTLRLSARLGDAVDGPGEPDPREQWRVATLTLQGAGPAAYRPVRMLLRPDGRVRRGPDGPVVVPAPARRGMPATVPTPRPVPVDPAEAEQPAAEAASVLKWMEQRRDWGFREFLPDPSAWDELYAHLLDRVDSWAPAPDPAGERDRLAARWTALMSAVGGQRTMSLAEVFREFPPRPPAPAPGTLWAAEEEAVRALASGRADWGSAPPPPVEVRVMHGADPPGETSHPPLAAPFQEWALTLPQKARDADELDLGRVYAPPEYTVRPSLRQASGPVIATQLGGAVWDSVRQLVTRSLDAWHRSLTVPHGIPGWYGRLLAEVDAAITDRLTGEFFTSSFEQLHGDELQLDLGPVEVTVSLILGDWTQVTDPRGVPFPDPDGTVGKPLGEVRTRQQHEFKTAVGTSRVHPTAAAVEPRFNYTGGLFRNAPSSLSGGLNAPVQVNNRTYVESSDVSTSTQQYVKASSYRAIGFRHDAGVIVTVRPPGGPARSDAQVLLNAVLARYSREISRWLPRPAGAAGGTTSLHWQNRTGRPEARTSTIQLLANGIRDGSIRWPPPPSYTTEPAALVPLPAPALPGTLPLHHPPARGVALGRWQPPPADRVVLPRLTWVDAIEGVDMLRRAVLAATKPELVAPGSAGRRMLTSSVTVGALKGGALRQLTVGGLLLPVLAEVQGRTLVTDLLMVTADSPTAVIRPAPEGRPDFERDDFSRGDTEDIYATGEGASQSHNVDSGLVLPFALAAGLTPYGGSWAPNIAGRRTFSITPAGRRTGETKLFKEKFEDGPVGEPHTLARFGWTVRVVSLLTGTVIRLPLSADLRLLHRDASVMPLLRDQFRLHPAPPAAPADRPWGWAEPPVEIDAYGEPLPPKEVQKARRTHPDRMLTLPAEFEGWLPPLSRISRWGPEIIQVFDNTVELILTHHPQYLPGIALLPDTPDAAGRTRVVLDPSRVTEGGLGNLVTLWNGLSESALAGIAHEAVSGGQPLVLTHPEGVGSLKPGPFDGRQLLLTVSMTYDRTAMRFTQGGIGGQQEIYHGFSAPVTVSRSQGLTVASDVTPTNHSIRLDQAGTGVPVQVDVPLPNLGGSYSAVSSEVSGMALGGATGGGSGWLAEFRGPVTIGVAVEELAYEHGGPKTPTGPEAGDSEAEDSEGEDSEGEAEEAGPAGAAVTPAGGPVRSITPVTVAADLLVPEDLTQEVVRPEGPNQPLADIPTAAFYTMATRSTLETPAIGRPWRPSYLPGATDVEKLPQDALYLPDVGPLLLQVLAVFRELGVTLSADERVRLTAQVRKVAQNFRDHDDRARTAWRTDRLDFGLFANTAAEVVVSIRTSWVDPRGHTDHSFRYLHGNTSAISRRETKEVVAWKGALSANLLGVMHGGDDKFGLGGMSGSYGRAYESRSSDQRTGASDRAQVDVSPQFWAVTRSTYDIRVVVGDRSSDGERVMARGLTLMPLAHAYDRGLADDSLDGIAGRDLLPTTRAWSTGPPPPPGDEWVELATFAPMLPEWMVLNASISAFGVIEVPELAHWRDELRAELVAEDWPAEVVDALDAEVSKVASTIGTYSALPELLVEGGVEGLEDLGGLPVMVAHRYPKQVVTVTGLIQLVRINPRFLNYSRSLEVIEPKNARGRATARGDRQTDLRTGGVGVTYAGTLDDERATDPGSGVERYVRNFLRSIGVDLRAGLTRSTFRDAATGRNAEKTLAVLNLFNQPPLFRWDIGVSGKFTMTIAPTSAVSDAATGFVNAGSKSLTVTRWQRDGLLASLPRPLALLDHRSRPAAVPPAGAEPGPRAHDLLHAVLRTLPVVVDPYLTGRPDPLVHTAPVPAGTEPGAWRTGLRLADPDLLAEVQATDDLGQLGRLRQEALTALRRPRTRGTAVSLVLDPVDWVGGSLGLSHPYPGPEDARYGWYFGDQWIRHWVATVVSKSFTAGNWTELLDGDGLEFTVLGRKVHIGLDIVSLDRPPGDPRTDETLVKDFQRITATVVGAEGAGAAVDASVAVTPRVTLNAPGLPSDADGQPDLRGLSLFNTPGLAGSVRAATGSDSRPTNRADTWEGGAKTSGRSYVQLTAGEVRWRFAAEGGPATIVTVRKDAFGLRAPAERVDALLTAPRWNPDAGSDADSDAPGIAPGGVPLVPLAGRSTGKQVAPPPDDRPVEGSAELLTWFEQLGDRTAALRGDRTTLLTAARLAVAAGSPHEERLRATIDAVEAALQEAARAAAALARLPFGPDDRLDQVARERRVVLRDRLRDLRAAVEAVTAAVVRGRADLVSGPATGPSAGAGPVPAPAAMTAALAAARTRAEARAARLPEWDRDLTAVRTALSEAARLLPVDLSGPWREHDRLRAEHDGALAAPGPVPVPPTDVLTVHLDERRLAADATRLDALADDLTALRAGLVEAVRPYETALRAAVRELAAGIGSAAAATAGRVRDAGEWIEEAVEEDPGAAVLRGGLDGAVAARDRALAGFDAAAGDLPLDGLLPAAADLRHRADGLADAGAALDGLLDRLRRRHPGLEPPPESAVAPLRDELGGLQREAARIHAALPGLRERLGHARSWLVIAAEDGADVTDLRRPLEEPAEVDDPPPDRVVDPRTARRLVVLRQHQARTAQIAAATALRAAVLHALQALDTMPAPPRLRRQILDLRGTWARLDGDRPEPRLRRALDAAERAGADVRALRDRQREAAARTAAVLEPFPAVLATDPATMTLRPAYQHRQQLQAAIAAGQNRQAVFAPLLAAAEELLRDRPARPDGPAAAAAPPEPDDDEGDDDLIVARAVLPPVPVGPRPGWVEPAAATMAHQHARLAEAVRTLRAKNAPDGTGGALWRHLDQGLAAWRPPAPGAPPAVRERHRQDLRALFLTYDQARHQAGPAAGLPGLDAALNRPVPDRPAPAGDGPLWLPSTTLARDLATASTRALLERWMRTVAIEDDPEWTEAELFLQDVGHRAVLLEYGRPLLRSLLFQRQQAGDLLTDRMAVHLALLDLAHHRDDEIGFGYLATLRPEERKELMVTALPVLGVRLVPVAQLHRGLRSTPSERAYATVLNMIIGVFNGDLADTKDWIMASQPHIGPRGRIAWVKAFTAWQDQRPPGDQLGRAALEFLKEWVVTCP